MKKPCNNCEKSIELHRAKTTVHYPNSSDCLKCEKYKAYLEYRKSKQKYFKGEPITTMKEFDEHIPDRFMYWNNKIYHIGWLMSLQYRLLKQAVENGHICIALHK